MSRRIALVGSYPPPHGGQSVHIQNLAKFLRAEGLDVQIFNTGSNKGIREPGVINVSNTRSLLTKLLVGPRFSLVHVHVSHARDYGKLAPVALAARTKGVPWLATIHSGDSGIRLRDDTPLHLTMAKALLGRAGRVICVNRSIADEVSALTGQEDVVVIPPFSIDFSPNRLPADVEGFLAVHNPVITCAGLFEPLYGFDQAVQLMPSIRAIYPRAGLLLLGDTKGADWCRTVIAAVGLEEHVRLCGNLGHEQCLDIINRSALFLRPTQFDGDSLSVREALALGVPVLASVTDLRPPGVKLYRRDVPGDLERNALSVLAAGTVATSAPAVASGNLEQVRRLYNEVMSR
jgi:glycogen(starch) synthase